MTTKPQVKELKKLAKRFARAMRIPQHEALDHIATELGFRHWNGLQIQAKRGWLATESELATLERTVKKSNPFANSGEGGFGALGPIFDDPNSTKSGTINELPYELSIVGDDIFMVGEGWCILVPEAPSASPIVEIDERYSDSCPIDNTAFLQEALAIACKESEKIHARISSDWSRRSTKPDAKGVVRHPLFHGLDGTRMESDTWFCLHCNGKISGEQIAKNLWHCPGCSASPIDIYSVPFWLGEGEKRPKPIAQPIREGRGEPVIKTVDKTLRLELNEEKITLLIRSALLDDAANTSERLGALLAEISVDEENDVWISFEANYWPEEKEPLQAQAVAKALGIAVNCDMFLDPPPFAWPDLAMFCSDTLEYTKLVLNAYEDHASSEKTK